jgi:hypothetical protein
MPYFSGFLVIVGLCQIFDGYPQNPKIPNFMSLKSALGGPLVALRSPQLGFPTVLSTAFVAIESSPQGVVGEAWSAQGCFLAGPPLGGSVLFCLGLCCYSLGIGPLEHRVSCFRAGRMAGALSLNTGHLVLASVGVLHSVTL